MLNKKIQKTHILNERHREEQLDTVLPCCACVSLNRRLCRRQSQFLIVPDTFFCLRGADWSCLGDPRCGRAWAEISGSHISDIVSKLWRTRWFERRCHRFGKVFSRSTTLRVGGRRLRTMCEFWLTTWNERAEAECVRQRCNAVLAIAQTSIFFTHAQRLLSWWKHGSSLAPRVSSVYFSRRRRLCHANSHSSTRRQRKVGPQPTRRGQLNKAHNAVATSDIARTSSQLLTCCTRPVNRVPVTILQMPPKSGTGKSSIAAFAALHSSQKILVWRRRDCKTQHLSRIGDNYTSWWNDAVKERLRIPTWSTDNITVGTALLSEVKSRSNFGAETMKHPNSTVLRQLIIGTHDHPARKTSFQRAQRVSSLAMGSFLPTPHPAIQPPRALFRTTRNLSACHKNGSESIGLISRSRDKKTRTDHGCVTQKAPVGAKSQQRASNIILPPLFRAQCFCNAHALGGFVCHSSAALEYWVRADGEGARRAPTNCWLRTCFLCILRTAWKTHTQEEARDHDAENQDEDFAG